MATDAESHNRREADNQEGSGHDHQRVTAPAPNPEPLCDHPQTGASRQNSRHSCDRVFNRYISASSL